MTIKILPATALRAALAAGAALWLAGCGSDELLSGSVNDVVASSFGVTPTGQFKDEVDLRARSPLVLPPDAKLPEPEEPEQIDEKLGANWPQDPDELARKEAIYVAKKKAEADEKLAKSGYERARVMSPQEMATWGRGLNVEERDYTEARSSDGQVMTPEELKKFRKAESDAAQIPPELRPLPPLPQ